MDCLDVKPDVCGDACVAKRCCDGWTGSKGSSASGGVPAAEEGRSAAYTAIPEDVVAVPGEIVLAGAVQSSNAVKGARGVDAGVVPVASSSARLRLLPLGGGGGGGGCVG